MGFPLFKCFWPRQSLYHQNAWAVRESVHFASLYARAPRASQLLAGKRGWHAGAEPVIPGEPPMQPWPAPPCQVAGASGLLGTASGSWSPSLQRGWGRREDLGFVLWKVEQGVTPQLYVALEICSLQNVSGAVSCRVTTACSLSSVDCHPGENSHAAWPSRPSPCGLPGRAGISFIIASVLSFSPLCAPMATHQIFSLTAYKSYAHTMSSSLIYSGLFTSSAG